MALPSSPMTKIITPKKTSAGPTIGSAEVASRRTPKPPRAARYHDGLSGRRLLARTQSKTGAEVVNALVVRETTRMVRSSVQRTYRLRTNRADT
jgi:hypothetical protein